MRKLFFTALVLISAFTSFAADKGLKVGAECSDEYVPLLRGKSIALLSNQSGIVPDGRHTLDIMLECGLDVVRIFSPEHGFRGTADAGEKVGSSVDEKTGIPIVSLYGGKESVDLSDVDIVVTDIQDVGLRFYTYYVTMLKMMDKAIEQGKEFMVLDRPNPNGMYVDGPILDMNYKSGVGWIPIPVVHGLTMGEIALMAEGEGWLKDSGELPLLHVVKCRGYTHQTRYTLPVRPSPNLPDMKAVYLYPSLCYFEATPVSVGRGTPTPFHMYGHPEMDGDFEFTPVSMFGARDPIQKDRLCHGRDLTSLEDEEIIAKGINLEYLIDAYNQIGKDNPDFFRNSFERLIGRGDIRSMIEEGRSPDEIKATWADDVERFKVLRRRYLLYEE